MRTRETDQNMTYALADEESIFPGEHTPGSSELSFSVKRRLTHVSAPWARVPIMRLELYPGTKLPPGM